VNTTRHALGGGLMVCGTASDAGKSTVVTGLCRLLARRGVRVAPFKGQNMALNSAVTPEGDEIGRAQASQAQAAGVSPEVAMNPILLKPTSDRRSQVVVMGRPWATLDAAEYQRIKPQLWNVVRGCLDELRTRFDVVICEGAGSPAEINLLDGDLVNLRLADAARLPAIVVGDIDRGGVFASLYGTVALLPDEWRPLVRGFVINKFRGDPGLLGGAPEELQRLSGVPTLGVLPMLDCPPIDSEDSLALRSWPSTGNPDGIDVAVVRFPRISNFTDLEALALEPGLTVRMVQHPSHLGSPDLLILPGTKSTVEDLRWLRETGLAEAIPAVAARAASRATLLGICGGYQMMGEKIDDAYEVSPPDVAAGLGLLPVDTEFESGKVTRVTSAVALGADFTGYEIHHGRTSSHNPWIDVAGDPEGSMSDDGTVLGTSFHGLFESDGFRAAFLRMVASRAGKPWEPSGVSFAKVRSERFDLLADAIEEHLDVDAILALIESARR
jgi:adenosylcobyric acid synthase